MTDKFYIDYESVGGRRFLLSFCCLYICTALLLGGYISELIYRDLVLGTVAVYIAGNTAQKFGVKP